MFLSGENSRNAFNNSIRYGKEANNNFGLLFKNCRLAHTDTVDNYLSTLTSEDIEGVKTTLIRSMLESKRISPGIDGHYLIAIDGVHIATYDHDVEDRLLSRASKSGTETWYHLILEAKIILPNGICFSIASEPITNKGKKQWDKQDCELKAFKRLMAKIKKLFPRLPVCILADGLYANAPVFGLCEQYGWKYIITLKDECLPLLREQITDTENARQVRTCGIVPPKSQKRPPLNCDYMAIAGLMHSDYRLNYIEAEEESYHKEQEGESIKINKFSYVTNLSLGDTIQQQQSRIPQLVKAGRMRWKIENQGFNTQKNSGYSLGHKFSRKSVQLQEIYYLLMQIAHIILQIVQHTKTVRQMLDNDKKLTFKYLWKEMNAILKREKLDIDRLNSNNVKCQIRLE